MEAALNSSAHPVQLTWDDLLQPFQRALTPPDLWRVGTEAEKFGWLADVGKPLPYDGPRSVRAVLTALQERYGWFPEHEYEGGPVIALRRGEASITLEPGAQLELSGAPFQSIHDTAAEWRGHIEELHEVSASLGIVWLGLGFHPFATQAELPWVPKLRYGVMKHYLPTRGSMGLDMMRRTCTVQANLDYASEADAMEKLRVALALSPIVSAMFANSPLAEGKLSGERSRRALVWLHMDPDRSGLLPFAWDREMSFARYIEWALDVPMFMVKRDGKIVHNTGQTFRAFMREGFQGTYATLDDWVVHLGTLFPEVRLKKTLEVRGADSLPSPLVPALPALWKGLLYEPSARAKAAQLVESLSHEQAEAARWELARAGLAGTLAGRPLREWAAEVLEIARAGLQKLNVKGPDGAADESIYLAPLASLVERGQTPADALLEKLDPTRDLVPQVLAHAKL